MTAKKGSAPTTPPKSVDTGPPPKRFATRADVVAQKDIKTEDVWVPEWDCWVRLKGLTEPEFILYQTQGMKTEPDPDNPNETIEVPENSSSRFLQHTLIGEDGERLFDDSPEALELLRKRSGMVVIGLATKAQKLSNIGVDSVEEAVENFGAITDGG